MGNYIWRYDGQLVAVGWLEKPPVYLLSTIHSPTRESTFVLRREGRGPRQPLTCPPAQVDYQKFMGGVDLADQLVKTFSLVQKS